jgi:hypothetical protein
VTIDDRTAAVIRQLTERTMEGEILWYVSSRRTEAGGNKLTLSCDLSISSDESFRWSVTRDSLRGAPDEITAAVFRIAEQGPERGTRTVFSTSAEDGGDQEQFDLLFRLFEAARNCEAGWGEALGQLETVLSGR